MNRFHSILRFPNPQSRIPFPIPTNISKVPREGEVEVLGTRYSAPDPFPPVPPFYPKVHTAALHPTGQITV